MTAIELILEKLLRKTKLIAAYYDEEETTFVFVNRRGEKHNLRMLRNEYINDIRLYWEVQSLCYLDWLLEDGEKGTIDYIYMGM